jgi:hypothetical protein
LVKSIKPNSKVLIEINIIPISGKEPPYSLRIVFQKKHTEVKHKKPKIIYPQGLLYLVLDRKTK